MSDEAEYRRERFSGQAKDSGQTHLNLQRTKKKSECVILALVLFVHLFTWDGMQTHPKLSLIEHFKTLTDPRVDRTKDHDLIDVLVIAICCLLCAGQSFNDMEDFGKAKYDWFKTFLSLRNGIPSHDTFNRVFQALDPKQFL